MIARDVRARSGITLTEILIAILIMGVGLISLATLFPLGLLRLREATRSSRGGLTFETAAEDMDTRALFYKPSFTQTWYWTGNANNPVPRDPFVQDAIYGSTVSTNALPGGVIASSPTLANGLNNQINPQLPPLPLLRSGLPFCYDPLWRSITGVVPYLPPAPNARLADPTLYYSTSLSNASDDARFGAGVFAGGAHPYLRDEPNPGNGGTSTPSAWGLQRLTNFIPWAYPTDTNPQNLNSQYPFTSTNFFYQRQGTPQPMDVAGTVFASNDDIVFNAFGGQANSPSPLIPDMSVGNQPQADYRFTWFVTGRQLDAGGNGLEFVGEVVVCDGRQFGFDPVPGLNFSAPAGETVVEAIFGYGTSYQKPNSPTSFATSNKTVLLRWKSNLPDPQVRVGGWICDVTYEASVTNFSIRSLNTSTTFARCYWYQIGKRTDPQPDATIPGYRSMVVTITSPVRDQTLLNTSDGSPVNLNAALIMPSVINVYPRSFDVHPITVP